MIGRALLASLALLAGEPVAAQTTTDARVAAAVAASGFQGTYLVTVGQRRVAGGSVGAAIEGQPGGFGDQAQWPWAAVTEQVVETLAMQEVEAGRIALDAPASRYLPAIGAPSPTVRQLIQHRAGLREFRNAGTDASGSSGGGVSPASVSSCLAGRGRIGSSRADNACDAIVLGALLERATDTKLVDLFSQRIGGTLGLSAGFIAPEATAPDARWPGGPTGDERREIAQLGAAGAMVGTAADLAAFDQGLLSGALLSAASRAAMWRGDAAAATSRQSVYSASLAGCAAPVRIVERRGTVGRFSVRNVILPDQGLAMVLFTNRAGASAQLGDIGGAKGMTYAILSAAACP